jgi:hypothetical protein
MNRFAAERYNIFWIILTPRSKSTGLERRPSWHYFGFEASNPTPPVITLKLFIVERWFWAKPLDQSAVQG